MRIAIIAAFPPHELPGCTQRHPGAHYATWLPQLTGGFEHQLGEVDLHWIFLAPQWSSPQPLEWRNQTFHGIDMRLPMRTVRSFRRECLAIKEKLDHLNPALVHAWGT